MTAFNVDEKDELAPLVELGVPLAPCTVCGRASAIGSQRVRCRMTPGCPGHHSPSNIVAVAGEAS